MSYKESYKKDFEHYENALKEYDKITSDKHFLEVVEEMPFAFLEAKHKYETLELYKDMYERKDAPFKFSRADEAINFFKGIIELRKKTDIILENANIVVRASSLAKSINEFVDESPYLSADLKINENERIANIAKDCLKKMPEFPSLMTKDFKISFVESCINSLSEDSLKIIVKTGYISKNDMNNIRLTGSKKYEENINFLQKEFGLDELVNEHHIIRLAGTSKDNPDGTKRQDILKQMAETKDEITLKCTKGIFKPEVGKELNSVEVSWNKKIAGYVPQAVVDQMWEKYEDPDFKADFKQIVGGGSVNYGCEVDLGVIGKEKEEVKKNEEEEERC